MNHRQVLKEISIGRKIMAQTEAVTYHLPYMGEDGWGFYLKDGDGVIIIPLSAIYHIHWSDEILIILEDENDLG